MFGDAYVAYTHLKALSTFVEAVLRYGLAGGQPDFVAYLIWPRPKKDDAVRKVLEECYGEGKKKDEGGEDDAMISRKEYFPYVSETISLFRDED